MKWILVVAAVVACKGDKTSDKASIGGPAAPGDRVVEGQSLEQAYELLCNATAKSGVSPSDPAKSQKIAVWIEANVRHPEAIAFMMSAGASDDPRKLLTDAARRYGVSPCPDAVPAPPPTPIDPKTVDLPAWSDAGGEEYDASRTLVVVTMTGLTLQGESLAPLVDGRLADDALTPLRARAASIKDPYVNIAVEKTVPTATVHQVCEALGSEGLGVMGLLGKHGDTLRVLRLSALAVTAPVQKQRIVVGKDDVRVIDGDASKTYKLPAQQAAFVKDMSTKWPRRPELVTVQMPDAATTGELFAFAAPLAAYVKPLLQRSAP